MISYYKEIVNSGVPSTRRWTSFECDWCGSRCNPNGNRVERLYEYDGEQLCADCLLEQLQNEGIIRFISEE